MEMRILRSLMVLGLVPGAAILAEEAGWSDPVFHAGMAGVNEGALVFLTVTPDTRILQTRNHLTISADSLSSGWVGLDQCQDNLDPVAAVEIEYRYEDMRGLRIVSARGMESAVVEGNTVQLSGVRRGAGVCIRAEVQVLKPDGGDGYRLQSGPFHRRFLDGYYPLQLDYRIEWPAGRLALTSVTPVPQPGFAVSGGAGSLQIDTLFEGILTLELQFEAME